jgi:hypothetical protein
MCVARRGSEVEIERARLDDLPGEIREIKLDERDAQVAGLLSHRKRYRAAVRGVRMGRVGTGIRHCVDSMG